MRLRFSRFWTIWWDLYLNSFNFYLNRFNFHLNSFNLLNWLDFYRKKLPVPSKDSWNVPKSKPKTTSPLKTRAPHEAKKMFDQSKKKLSCQGFSHSSKSISGDFEFFSIFRNSSEIRQKKIPLLFFLSHFEQARA